MSAPSEIGPRIQQAVEATLGATLVENIELRIRLQAVTQELGAQRAVTAAAEGKLAALQEKLDLLTGSAQTP